MKVALVQSDIAWENKPVNFRRIRELLAHTPFRNGGLIVLPELFATGFTMDSEAIAEDNLGESETFLLDLAREKGAHVMGGVALHQKPGVKPANCASIATPDGQIICRYQKTHPFSLGSEHEHYSRGEKVEIVTIDGIRMAPSICYDLRFPETYRIAAHLQAHAYVVIANWPDKRIFHWTTLLRARAIENQAYVIGVNRCGQDPNLTYNGHSALVDYMGEIVADGGTSEGVIESELNLENLLEWRKNFPALRDMHDQLS